MTGFDFLLAAFFTGCWTCRFDAVNHAMTTVADRRIRPRTTSPSDFSTTPESRRSRSSWHDLGHPCRWCCICRSCWGAGCASCWTSRFAGSCRSCCSSLPWRFSRWRPSRTWGSALLCEGESLVQHDLFDDGNGLCLSGLQRLGRVGGFVLSVCDVCRRLCRLDQLWHSKFFGSSSCSKRRCYRCVRCCSLGECLR